MFSNFVLFKSSFGGLTDVAQWIECWPGNQRVTGLIPSQAGHTPGLWARSPVGGRGRVARGNHALMFLSLSLSPPSSLSINKIFKKSSFGHFIPFCLLDSLLNSSFSCIFHILPAGKTHFTIWMLFFLSYCNGWNLQCNANRSGW